MAKLWRILATPLAVAVVVSFSTLTLGETTPQGTGASADTCHASGNLDGDDALTVADYVYALRVMLGYEPPPANLYEFDLNGDCVVDTADASVLSCYFIFGMSCIRSPFPVLTCCSPTLVTYTCPVPLTGDVTSDSRITSADIIYAVCLGFVCDPIDFCVVAAADVNCSGGLTSADIIYLVNYVFRGGPAPSDVCPLILDGPWTDTCD